MFKDRIYQYAENLKALREFVDLIGPFLINKREEFTQVNLLSFGPFVLALNKLDPSTYPLTPEAEDKIANTFQSNLEINVIESDDSEKKSVELTISGELSKDVTNTIKGLSISLTHERLLYNNALISLISFVEWFLSHILHGHLINYPDKLGGKDKVLSYKDIKEFNSIEEAIKHIISAKVQEILWGSFEDWITYFREQVKLSMGYMDECKSRLVEIFQRRNLIIHNGGIINSTYLSKVSPELRAKLSSGDIVKVDRDYLESSINLVERCFILLASELWKQVDSSDEVRGRTLIDIAFEHLCKERWDIAESLSFFIINDKGLPERDRLIAQINYWQSLKWQGKFEEIKSSVENGDFSAKDEIFRLTQLALLDKKEDFYSLLPHILEMKKLSIPDLNSWPIFREMRKDPLFRPYDLEASKNLQGVTAIKSLD